jgi:hypothetical protein
MASFCAIVQGHYKRWTDARNSAEQVTNTCLRGVLVAISIPIFTSQLEKAREGVDEANLRSLYAEAVSASLLGDTDATTDIKGATLSCTKQGDNTFKVTADLELTQQKDGLTGADSVDIEGVDVASGSWKKGGTMEIVITSDGKTKTIAPKS